MDFLATAARPIPSHTVLALLAVLIGGIQLALAKGTAAHRWLGRVWVSLMTYVVISSFFISKIKTWRGFSSIHLLSAWTLLSLVVAVYHARAGNFHQHQSWIVALSGLALTESSRLCPAAHGSAIFGHAKDASFALMR